MSLYLLNVILAKASFYDITFVFTLCFGLALTSFPRNRVEVFVGICVESIKSKQWCKRCNFIFLASLFHFSIQQFMVCACAGMCVYQLIYHEGEQNQHFSQHAAEAGSSPCSTTHRLPWSWASVLRVCKCLCLCLSRAKHVKLLVQTIYSSQTVEQQTCLFSACILLL